MLKSTLIKSPLIKELVVDDEVVAVKNFIKPLIKPLQIMPIDKNRRKRRRKPTMTPRFGDSTIALEIGLLRMSLGMERELDENKIVKFEGKKN